MWHHTGGEEEDGFSKEEMNVSHDDMLSNAVIKSNNARGASSGAEESPVQQSQGVSYRGCEGENGKEREWCHLPGGENLTVGDRDKDKEDDNNSGASSAPRDKGKEDDQVGCSQEKFEVNNTRRS